MSDPVKLPATLLSSQDPVDGNPFPVGHAAHDAWRNATFQAEEILHRFNARVLEHGPEIAARGVDGYHAMTLDLTAGKFDIWSQRGLSVVWGRTALEHYDQWLFRFAESCLETVRRDALKRQMASRIADLEHDTVVYRELAQGALAIAFNAKRDAAHERRQRLALAEEYRQLRTRLMTAPRVPLRSLATMARNRRTSAAMLALSSTTATTSRLPAPTRAQ